MAENTRLLRPSAGKNVVLPVGQDAHLEFAFNQADAELGKEGSNLVLSFDDGAKITLEGFYDNFGEGRQPPVLIVEGESLPGETFLAALNNPDLMPLAGPAAASSLPGGGSYGDANLSGVDGVDGLDKLEFDGWTAASAAPSTLASTTRATDFAVAPNAAVGGDSVDSGDGGDGGDGGDDTPVPLPEHLPYEVRAVLYASESAGDPTIRFRLLDFSAGDSISALNQPRHQAVAEAAFGGADQRHDYFNDFSYNPATGLASATLNQRGLDALTEARAGGENLYEYVTFTVGGRAYTMQVVINHSGLYDSKEEDIKHEPRDGALAWGEWHSETDYLGTGGRASSDLGDELRFTKTEDSGRWDAAYSNQALPGGLYADALKTGAGDDFVEITSGADVDAALRYGNIDMRDQAGDNDGDNTIIIKGESGYGMLYGGLVTGTGNDTITVSGAETGAGHNVRIVDEGGDNVITVTGEKESGLNYGSFVGGYDGNPTGVLTPEGGGIHTGEGNDSITVSGGIWGLRYNRITDQGGTNVIRVIGDSDGDGRGSGMDVAEIVARGDNTITVESGIYGGVAGTSIYNRVPQYSSIITAEGEDHIRVTDDSAGANNNVIINTGTGANDTVVVAGGTCGAADNVSVASVEGRVAVAATGVDSTEVQIAGAAQRFQSATTKIIGREVDISSGYEENAQGEWNIRGGYTGDSYGLHAKAYRATVEVRGMDSVDVKAYSAGGAAAGAYAATGGATNAVSGGKAHIAAASSGGNAYALNAENFTSGTALNRIDAHDVEIGAFGGYAAGARAVNGNAEYSGSVINTHKAHNAVNAEGEVKITSSWHGMEASAKNGEAKNSVEAGEMAAVTAGDSAYGVAMQADSTGKDSAAKNIIDAKEVILRADSKSGQGMNATQHKTSGAARNEILSEGDVEINVGYRAMYADGQDRNDSAGTGAVNIIDAGGRVSLIVKENYALGMGADGAGKNIVQSASANEESVFVHGQGACAVGAYGKIEGRTAENIIDTEGGVRLKIDGLAGWGLSAISSTGGESGSAAKNTILAEGGVKIEALNRGLGMGTENNTAMSMAENIIDAAGNVSIVAGDHGIYSGNAHSAAQGAAKNTITSGGVVTVDARAAGMSAESAAENAEAMTMIKADGGVVITNTIHGMYAHSQVTAAGSKNASSIEVAAGAFVEIDARMENGHGAGMFAMNSGENGTAENSISSSGAVRVEITCKSGAPALEAWYNGKNTITANSAADSSDEITLGGDMKAASGGTNRVVTGAGGDMVNVLGGVDAWGEGKNSIITGAGDDSIHLAGKIGYSHMAARQDAENVLTLRAGEGGHDTLVLEAADAESFRNNFENWFNALDTDGLKDMDIESIRVMGLEPGGNGAKWLEDIVSDYNNTCANDKIEFGYVRQEAGNTVIQGGSDMNDLLSGTADSADIFTWTSLDNTTDTIRNFDMLHDKLHFSDLLGGDEAKLDALLRDGQWNRDDGVFTADGDGIHIEFKLDMADLQASLKLSCQDAQEGTHTQNVQFENFSNFSFQPDMDDGAQKVQVAALLEDIIKVTG